MSTKTKLQVSNRCSACENNSSILNYIAYLRNYQRVLNEYLERGKEEYVKLYTRRLKDPKKPNKKAIKVESITLDSKVLTYEDKLRINEEIKKVNQIIQGYERYNRSNQKN